MQYRVQSCQLRSVVANTSWGLPAGAEAGLPRDGLTQSSSRRRRGARDACSSDKGSRGYTSAANSRKQRARSPPRRRRRRTRAFDEHGAAGETWPKMQMLTKVRPTQHPSSLGCTDAATLAVLRPALPGFAHPPGNLFRQPRSLKASPTESRGSASMLRSHYWQRVCITAMCSSGITRWGPLSGGWTNTMVSRQSGPREVSKKHPVVVSLFESRWKASASAYKGSLSERHLSGTLDKCPPTRPSLMPGGCLTCFVCRPCPRRCVPSIQRPPCDRRRRLQSQSLG